MKSFNIVMGSSARSADFQALVDEIQYWILYHIAFSNQQQYLN